MPASARSGASRPTSIPDCLALVGDASDGYPGLPGWGAKSAAAVLARYGRLEAIPAPGVRPGRCRASAAAARSTLAATLRDHLDEALLYRDLARLRTAEDGVQIRQRDPDELRWDGAPRATWEAFCDEWGLERLRTRPHRWRGPRSLARPASEPSSRRGGPAARRGCRSTSGPCARSNHGPPSMAVTRRPAPLGDEPGRGDVPGRQPALLDERIEPPVRDVGQRERRRAHRSARCGSPCARSGPAVATALPESASEMTKSRAACPCPTPHRTARRAERRHDHGRAVGPRPRTSRPGSGRG